MSKAKIVSAKTVRQFFRDNDDKLVTLATEDMDADTLRARVALGARGTLPTVLVDGYRRHTRSKKVYERGATDAVLTEVVKPTGKTVLVPTSAVRAFLGHAEGRRGRISKTDKALFAATL